MNNSGKSPFFSLKLCFFFLQKGVFFSCFFFSKPAMRTLNEIKTLHLLGGNVVQTFDGTRLSLTLKGLKRHS